jgi:LysR family transcriptional regulator for metE and metH
LAAQEFIEPSDLTEETLIAYPVEAKRLDIIANFMTPAQVSFENVRTTELTAMLIQLVASERGVAALPDWVVAEYEKKGWVVSRKLGAGVHCQLYAATRTSSQDTAYMQGFANLLEGIVKPL